MKTLLFVFLLGCSSEPIGTSSQAWFDTCPVQYSVPDVETCSTLYYLKCKDGADGFIQKTALSANYIGTWCYKEQDKTYYYVCGINKNEAWVYCNFPGDQDE